MRNPSIAFAILVAACGPDTPVDLEGPCGIDPSSQACRCDRDPTLPECVTTPPPDATIDSDLVLFYNESGSAFFGYVVDQTAFLDELIGTEEDFYGSIPEGTCTTAPIADVLGEPVFVGVGRVQALRDGAVVVELAPDASSRYEELLDPGVVNLGDSLDLELEGGGIFEGQTVGDLVRVMEAFPAFDGVTNNTLPLTQTITFATPGADRTRLTTSYIDPQGNAVSLTCIATNGTFTFDDATFAALPPSGGISLTGWNTTFVPLTTTDDSVRAVRGQVVATKNVQYIK